MKFNLHVIVLHLTEALSNFYLLFNCIIMVFHQLEPVFLDFNFDLVFGLDISKPPPFSFFQNRPPPSLPNVISSIPIPITCNPPPSINLVSNAQMYVCKDSQAQKDYNRFFKLKTKIVTIGSDIKFLRNCKLQGICPRFVNLKIKIDSWISKKVLSVAQKTWINLELKTLYSKRSRLELELYNLHLKITKNLGSQEFQNFLEKTSLMNNVIESKNNKKLSVQDRKLTKLLSQLPKPSEFVTENVSRLIPNTVNNLSKQIFSDCELKLLSKGLNFMLPPVKAPLETLVFDIEAAIKFIPEAEKHSIRKACKKSILDSKSKLYSNKLNVDYKIIKALKQKDCFYMKADKSNTVVIMDKTDYFEKVQQMIDSGPYTLLSENPLKSKGSLNFQNKCKQALKDCKNLIHNDRLRLKLTVSNPVLPKLYCLPKIHKVGIPMRPIVSGINCPTYLLSKWLVDEFSKLTPPIGFSVKNSYEFIDSISNFQLLPNEYLVSFDVSSLFPSIPIPETIEILEQWLISNQLPDCKVKEFLLLTRLCMNQNAFQFNSKIYSQEFGTAMGNPLSPFLANLFMSHFETVASSYNSFPRLFKRYVDDIFAVVNYSPNELADFIEYLNGLYPSIKFTHEVETNNSLPFLDILVIRKDSKFEFDVYRKPTQVDRYIDISSFHTIQHKLAAFNSMIYRMLRFPLNKSRKLSELNYIKKVANLNGFSKNVVDNIVRKQQFAIQLMKTTTLKKVEENKKWAKLTFFPPLSNKIRAIFSEHNIQAAFYGNSKLKSLLGNTKDKIPFLEKAGIYKIKCRDCNFVYIGQTVRNLETRFKEHLDSHRLCRPNRSSVAKHMIEKDHSFSINDIKLISSIDNSKIIDAAETFFIFREKSPLMNLDQGPLRYSCLFDIFPNNSRHQFND